MSNTPKPLCERIEDAIKSLKYRSLDDCESVVTVLEEAQAEIARLSAPLSDEDLEREYQGVMKSLNSIRVDCELVGMNSSLAHIGCILPIFTRLYTALTEARELKQKYADKLEFYQKVKGG